MDNYLIQYREAIKRGDIIAGNELITELDNLIRRILSQLNARIINAGRKI